MKKIFALLTLLLTAAVFCGSAYAAERSNEADRVQDAAIVLDEIMSNPDKAIPQEIFGSAKCVAVAPSMLKGAIIFGVNRGKGIASCRTAAGWSTPAFFVMEGGSVGFQIGGQAVDLVILIMDDSGMRKLLSSKFKLGKDASVAAGPVGRHTEDMYDWKTHAEVLTYSRARGAFAGVSLNGASIHQHTDDTRAFYGRMVPFRTLLLGHFKPMPEDAAPWIATLKRYTPNPSDKAKTAPAPSGAAPPARSTQPPASEKAPAPEGSPDDRE